MDKSLYCQMLRSINAMTSTILLITNIIRKYGLITLSVMKTNQSRRTSAWPNRSVPRWMRTAIPFFGKILFGGYSSVKIKVKSALVKKNWKIFKSKI